MSSQSVHAGLLRKVASVPHVRKGPPCRERQGTVRGCRKFPDHCRAGRVFAPTIVQTVQKQREKQARKHRAGDIA